MNIHEYSISWLTFYLSICHPALNCYVLSVFKHFGIFYLRVLRYKKRCSTAQFNHSSTAAPFFISLLSMVRSHAWILLMLCPTRNFDNTEANQTRPTCKFSGTHRARTLSLPTFQGIAAACPEKNWETRSWERRLHSQGALGSKVQSFAFPTFSGKQLPLLNNQ